MTAEQARAILLNQASQLRPDRQRALDGADIDLAISLFERAVATFNDRDIVGWRVTLHGGFLPNSYKWKAEADVLVLGGGRSEDGSVAISRAALGRTASCKRPHGRGNTRVIHVLKIGQTLGRVVSVDSLLPAKETK